MCTNEQKPLFRGKLWEQLFLCISGLPVRIREKAALPPLNVSWCLPGCLFWEQIKGGPLPLAPTKGEGWGAEGARRGNRGGWMSFYKAGLMGERMDRFSDGCPDRWIQTYIAPGSHLICNAYVFAATYGMGWMLFGDPAAQANWNDIHQMWLLISCFHYEKSSWQLATYRPWQYSARACIISA